MAVFCGLVAFVFTKDLILYPVARMAERFFYSSGGEYREELSHVESLVSAHKYDEALAELMEFIEDNPESSLPRRGFTINSYFYKNNLVLAIVYSNRIRRSARAR